MYRSLVGKGFSPMIMIAHLITMIREENDNGMIIHPTLFQLGHQFAYLIINKSNIGIVMFFGFFYLRFSKIPKRSRGRAGCWDRFILMRIVIDLPFPITDSR